MNNPITFANKAKGTPSLLRRVHSVANRYGLTPAKMDRALHQFAQILKQFDCGASFALTGVALKRNSETITKFLNQNIEFVVHGYTHIDYSKLAPEEQLVHLRRVREIFDAAGIKAVGFRSPYLRVDSRLHRAVEEVGFSYVSNQPILWNVLDANVFTLSTYASYERAIDFYAPWLASERPSLPQLYKQFVEIPVSLPDDEILVDRLDGVSKSLVEQAWQSILFETYQRGELFTIQVHPERITLCADSLSAVLAEARSFTPAVWLARLDEIATWWCSRSIAEVEVRETNNSTLHLSVTGPPGTTILARNVEILGPSQPWFGSYQQVAGTICAIRTTCRPFIGVSSDSPLSLTDFLRQQGYIVQISDDSQAYPIYLNQTSFVPQHELPLLAQIEQSTEPLVRLGRWPNGARSALCVTGDIDALTLWDYGLRLFGK